MKYGKYLASRQLELPEYSGHFIDYKALKKLIKQLAIPSNKENVALVVNIHQSLKENKATFFFRVERELDKVNSFYLEKQANLSINLDLLLRKKEQLFLKTYDYIQLMKNDAATLNGGQGNSSSSSNGGSSGGGASNDSNFRNSISYLNLYQNFKKIHQDLLRLQQFIELNETGFSKVLKKWDKRSKSHTKELFILTAVSVQPVFHKNEINDVSDLVTQSLFDLESIMDGDYTALETFAAKNSPSIKNSIERSDSTRRSGGNFPGSERHQSIASMSGGTFLSRPMINNQIDDLYSSFVNVATVQDPTDTSLLKRWLEKLKTVSEGGGSKDDLFSEETRFKISRIFLLSLSNIRISDVFLESFLKIINYQVDFTYVSDDFNNNRTIIHECCSIPPATKHEHVPINNGVRVVNANDYIAHSRTFIIDYIMTLHLDEESKHNLLVAKDGNGKTCLHYAAQNSRLDILDIVLPNFPKENVDDLDNESMSALLLAIKNQNFTVIQKLMEHGSDCYPKSTETRLQYLPINYACQVGNYEILEYLLSFSKPDKELINQQDVEGLMPLHVVARSGNYKLIKLLIEYGAEINRLDGLNKWSPIFYAVLEGHPKTTEELVKLGARLNLVDNDGFNVLYYCVVEGHIDVLNELLIYKDSIFDEKKESLDSILSSTLESNIEKESSMSILDEGEDSEDSGSILKNNVDSIPDLQLPPPVLPLRRYGHNFLEQKLLIELIFPSNTSFIKFFDSATDLNPGRITLTSNISDIVPRNILLSVSDGIRANGNNCIFQTDLDSLTDFRIDFEIFPKFGTRLIAKTTALLFSQIDPTSPMVNSFQLPLFDLRLRNIGELKVHYQVIYPFAGTLLEASKFDTYWKSSTSVLKNRPSKLNAAGGLSPNSILSPVSVNSQLGGVGGNALGSTAVPSTNELISGSTPSSVVTATSLSGEYLRIKICLLNDGTPIVCPHWSIAITDSIELFLPNLSLEQLTSITNSLFDYNKVIQDLSGMTIEDLQLIKSLIRIIYLPLDIVLDVLSPSINLNMEIMFPSAYELEGLPFNGGIHKNLNNYIDFTLNDVFNHVRELKLKSKSRIARSIIFLSSNSLICKILNWKQPNFPVFLIMSGISYSLEKNKFESRTTNGLLIDSLGACGGSDMNNKQSYNGDSEESISTAHLRLHELQNDLNHQELAIRSIKEAVNFSINNNLIGIITSIHLLNLVPKMIPLVRSRGLVLVAASDLNDREAHKEEFNYELDAYTKTEINGLRFDDVLSFKEDITM
ncbi:phosphate system positive regulatory protein pho81 [Scheffersomyces spartinae]|uniref:Phosphate system positive regulatory protein pho81 n=1 Tax=Scheffersomyces spartinae TaxID=45513 RepID=A0A9P7V5Q4_9ASCO|nr:phosphate system positive regulatory protein pho81 [Scheffersomyces spartinae]KAG7191762.1 phosphate system positive regulatory protein pho81 [Scheffersomyces spartinae]